MSLLPSRSEASPPEEADPRVVGVDSEDAEEVLAALSSGTAREVLTALHDQPAPASELADRVDTSLQNTQYHLEKLADAGVIEVVDTAYSAKGREMDVYAPADRPLVVFAGEKEKESTLKSALSRLLGAVGLLGVASLAVQRLFGPGGLFGPDERAAPAAGAPAGGGETPTSTPEATPTPDGTPAPEGFEIAATEAPEPTVERDAADGALEVANETVATATREGAATLTPTETVDPTTAADVTREAGAGLPPGLVFFIGGLFALGLAVGVVYLRG